MGQGAAQLIVVVLSSSCSCSGKANPIARHSLMRNNGKNFGNCFKISPNRRRGPHAAFSGAGIQQLVL